MRASRVERSRSPPGAASASATADGDRLSAPIATRAARRRRADADGDERELKRERGHRVPRAHALARALRHPVIRRAARASRGLEALGRRDGSLRPRARHRGAFERAVHLGEDGDERVPHGLGEAAGEPPRARAAQVHGDEDAAGPRDALVHAQERRARDERGPARAVARAARREHHHRRNEAHDAPEKRDGLAPVAVREAAHEQVARRLEQRERHEERALAAVAGLRELAAGAVQHRELVELQGRAHDGGHRADHHKLAEVAPPGRRAARRGPPRPRRRHRARARRSRAAEYSKRASEWAELPRKVLKWSTRFLPPPRLRPPPLIFFKPRAHEAH